MEAGKNSYSCLSPSNKHLQNPHCIDVIGWIEGRDEDTILPFKMPQFTWGHSYMQLTVTESKYKKCYKKVQEKISVSV